MKENLLDPDGREALAARGSARSWEVITVSTGNTAVAYDTRQEAVAAAAWLSKTYGHELAVVGFDANGEAVERVECPMTGEPSEPAAASSASDSAS